MEKRESADRTSIGLVELDKTLGGGIPRGSLLLLSGNPGAGKTIFSTHFLYHGANLGEKGVYVSFAENRADYYRNMLQLGMDMQSLEEKGIFKLMDFATMDEAGMRKAVEMVIETVIDFGAKRLVIDSITAILQILGRDQARIFLHSILGRLVKSIGITAIVIGELPYGASKTDFGVEEFVADAVMMLKFHRIGTASKRELEIAKMRGVSLEHTSFEFLIGTKYGGIGIITLPTILPTEFAPTEKLSTGVRGLDAMLEGGVYRESITMIEGAGGIGKTTLCLQFLIANVEEGERALFLSFEEPVGQITRLLKNYNMPYEKFGEHFHAESFIPETLTPLHYYRILNEIIETYRPTVIALDGISTLHNALPEKDFMWFVRYLQLLCKKNGLTAFLTSTLGMLPATMQSAVSNIADNVIVMRYYEDKYGLEREIAVVKTRASGHDHSMRIFEIGKKGIVIHARPV